MKKVGEKEEEEKKKGQQERDGEMEKQRRRVGKNFLDMAVCVCLCVLWTGRKEVGFVEGLGLGRRRAFEKADLTQGGIRLVDRYGDSCENRQLSFPNGIE